MEAQKILKAHERQIWLSGIIAKVGYNSPIGKLLRLWVYYTDGFIILRAWRDYLTVRQQYIGDKFYGVDQAIIHGSHADVKELMHVEPQLRGNDLGIIRILADSYMLGNPLTLGMNGDEHTGARAAIVEALRQPTENADVVANLVDTVLQQAAQKGKLHVGEDLPRMMVWILHKLVFDISLSESEAVASVGYIKGLVLSSLPNFVSKVLLSFKTRPNIQHRERLIAKYKQSEKWLAYFQAGVEYGLNDHQIANSLCDMIHIAGTAGTSALLGSVIGVLCLDDNLRNQATKEVNAVWDGQSIPNNSTLERMEIINKIILETARFYPPVRFVSQLTTEKSEVTIGQTKCPVQKGTRLLGSIFNANHDPRRYENPDTFNIERDYSDIVSWNGKDHERACPGRDLSVNIIKIFCLYLLKKYRWDSITEVVWDFDKVTAVTPNTLILQGFRN